MRNLIKIMLVLACVFATTFVIAKLTGVISVEKITVWLEAAKNTHSYYIAIIVILLLILDIIFAVPTLTIMILSGYFLGFGFGAMSSIIGVMIAGIIGYTMSYLFGEKFEKLIIKDEQQRLDSRGKFNQYGIVMILLSRAMPILPEVTACMSGITKMPFLTFLCTWIVSSVPYAFIASYAGSISTLDNPKPVIFTAIALAVFFWSGWFIFQKYSRKK